MNNQVELQIGYRDDEKIVSELIEFFAPVASPSVRKREETAAKAWVDPIVVALTILGEWAAQRYVLDPLANRAEEWWQAIAATWRRSESRRSFDVSVVFEHDTDRLEVEVSDTSDEETLKQVWSYVSRAHRICQSARDRGISLSKVRILPDGMQDVFVIGYESNRPSYIIDLPTGALRRIKAPDDESQDSHKRLWVVEQLIRRLQYLQTLARDGYEVSEEEHASHHA
jgi:hypothetical protein